MVDLNFWHFSDPIVEVNAVVHVRHFRQPWVLLRKIWQSSNCMCRPYILVDTITNNPQGMQLGRFKNCTPARFEYIYCTLFPLCHSN
jgi:hypothetical protein